MIRNRDGDLDIKNHNFQLTTALTNYIALKMCGDNYPKKINENDILTILKLEKKHSFSYQSGVN